MTPLALAIAWAPASPVVGAGAPGAAVVVAGAVGALAGAVASDDGACAVADGLSLVLWATAALPTSSAEAIQPASKILLVAVTRFRPCSSAGGRLHHRPARSPSTDQAGNGVP